MSPVGSEPGPNTQQLRVEAGNPGVRIEVLDHGYHLVASGYGRIRETLPTGIYTVRYLAANARAERRVVLLPDKAQELLDAPELPFASPAPFDLTTTSREHHQARAEELSHKPTLALGQGSELLVFVRDLEPEGKGNPALGLTLHQRDASGAPGKLHQDLAAVMRKSDGPLAAWAGGNFALDPGCYLLRLRLEGGRSAEMALHLVPGWQHQVFLLRRGGGLQHDEQALPDLPGAAHLMSRPYLGFEPRRRVRRGGDALDPAEDLRFMELARFALLQGRTDISAEAIATMLTGKWLDPLLGIVGLHLLLMQDEPDLAKAQSVEARLSKEVLNGAFHPDVQILRREIRHRLGDVSEAPPLHVPPMLRRSWDLLVRQSATWPQVIPRGSLCDTIADRQWGSGAWLLWETPAEERATEAGGLFGQVFESAGGVATNWGHKLRAMTVSGAWSAPRVRDLLDQSPLLRWCASEVPGAADARVDAKFSLEPFPRVEDPAAAAKALGMLMTELGTPLRLRELAEGPALSELADEAGLGEAEHALLLYLVAQLGFQRRRRTTAATEPVTLGTLIVRLGLPATHVAAAVIGLITKLAQYELRQLAEEARARSRIPDALSPAAYRDLTDRMRVSHAQFGEAAIGALMGIDLDRSFDSSADPEFLLKQEIVVEAMAAAA